MLAFLSTKIGRLVSALVAGAAIVFGAIQYGKREQRQEAKVEDLEDYIKTKKELDDVKVSPDRDAAFKRLQRNGWLR